VRRGDGVEETGPLLVALLRRVGVAVLSAAAGGALDIFDRRKLIVNHEMDGSLATAIGGYAPALEPRGCCILRALFLEMHSKLRRGSAILPKLCPRRLAAAFAERH